MALTTDDEALARVLAKTKAQELTELVRALRQASIGVQKAKYNDAQPAFKGRKLLQWLARDPGLRIFDERLLVARAILAKGFIALVREGSKYPNLPDFTEINRYRMTQKDITHSRLRRSSVSEEAQIANNFAGARASIRPGMLKPDQGRMMLSAARQKPTATASRASGDAPPALSRIPVTLSASEERLPVASPPLSPTNKPPSSPPIGITKPGVPAALSGSFSTPPTYSPVVSRSPQVERAMSAMASSSTASSPSSSSPGSRSPVPAPSAAVTKIQTGIRSSNQGIVAKGEPRPLTPSPSPSPLSGSGIVLPTSPKDRVEPAAPAPVSPTRMQILSSSPSSGGSSPSLGSTPTSTAPSPAPSRPLPVPGAVDIPSPPPRSPAPGSSSSSKSTPVIEARSLPSLPSDGEAKSPTHSAGSPHSPTESTPRSEGTPREKKEKKERRDTTTERDKREKKEKKKEKKERKLRSKVSTADFEEPKAQRAPMPALHSMEKPTTAKPSPRPAQQAKQAIDELLRASEAAYVEALRAGLMAYVEPLPSEGVFTPAEVRFIASNLAELLSVHTTALKSLTARAPPVSVLSELSQHLGAYTLYAANLSSALELVEDAKTDAVFAEFLARREAAGARKMEDFLHLPLVHLAGYSRFARDYASDSALASALEPFRQTQKVIEQRVAPGTDSRLWDLRYRLASTQELPPSDALVIDGIFERRDKPDKPQPYVGLFLFSDKLLLTSLAGFPRHRLKDTIPLASLHAVDVPDTQDYINALEIARASRPGRGLRVSFPTAEDKAAWVDQLPNVRKLLRVRLEL